jgi:NADH-quinone oxidoreductase subunit N
MIEGWFIRLLIIIEDTDWVNFPSDIGFQWSAFIHYLSSSSSNPLHVDWWLFIFNLFSLKYISSDLVLYAALPILLIHFGMSYSHKTSEKLLVESLKLSYAFVFLAFMLFVFQMAVVYFSSNIQYLSFLKDLYILDLFIVLSKFFMFVIWLSLHKFMRASVLLFKKQGVAEFPILSYLIFCFSIIIISSGNLAFLFISLEGFSLILYIMASIGRSYGGITAAVKYYIFGTAGSVLVLWGAVHLYEVSSSLSFKVFSFLSNSLDELPLYHPLIDKVEWASTSILIGLLIKLGVAPTHQWVPDVYAGVNIFVTSFYSIFIKFVLYMLFLYVSFQFVSNFEIEFAAALSLLIGCFGTLRQVEIKRFLAYGSITHIGFLLIGDYVASIIYLASYVLASLAFFSVLLSLRVNGSEFTYISDLRLIASSKSQWDRLIIVLSLASMAGLPPFAGFYGKMFIWVSLIEDIYCFNDIHSYVLLIVTLITSLIIIFYYIRLIVILYIGNENSSDLVLLHQITESELGLWNYSNILNIRVLQYMLIFLLVFWTAVIPLGLSLSISSSEHIV